jgi:hypothetical protein
MVISFVVERNETDLEVVILSSRLVKSPCAIIADAGGYTANVAKLMGEFPSAFKILPAKDQHSRI